MEIIDVIGYSRGYSWAMPDFGGVVWSHFNNVERHFSDEWHYKKAMHNMLELYTDFKKITKITKIICGHTQYVDAKESEIRYRKMKGIEETGLEYICIDNGCSEAYRERKGSVINGIEIDENGDIITPISNGKLIINN